MQDNSPSFHVVDISSGRRRWGRLRCIENNSARDR
jgi:hypothetical protein